MRPTFLILAASALVLNFSSCVVVHPVERHDNGLHKGWYKNPNNPHNPSHGTTPDNNGKGKGKHKQP